MTLTMKQAHEFGQTVTLYRVVTEDGSNGTLWHSTEAKAWAAWQRLAPLKGWA